ncbi:molybdate ABC transporter substrate-binding protein [Mesoterricola sediminis]|uniref:Molybdate ABC transporter substrate-binding protein n=1 Tax=Mesoterricola sediminis TaxID=2927980 RepID=A0AA48H1P3_9BACT|nr:molybdate ABC transporter substrate-binding protein [Mesoterricola sediminis]BDU78375.1 molybdate ABC transporter substrate-binding protein [Mesoterricola sediminis]
MLRRALLTLLCALFAAGPALRAQGPRKPLSVVAAADLRGVFDELKAAFEARTPGVELKVAFGASGSLTAQILQGAPFDVFLAADTGFPEQVRKAGLATPEGPFPYALGTLTLWVRRDLGLDPARDGLQVLTSPALRKIATANPQVAPYGRAGEAALRHAGLYDQVRSRLVFADNIAQAAQFLQTGTAEAGLISLAQAEHPALRQSGIAWRVPADAYPPLRQAGVILARTQVPEQARAFRAFLLGPEGQGILARHGFGKP